MFSSGQSRRRFHRLIDRLHPLDRELLRRLARQPLRHGRSQSACRIRPHDNLSTVNLFAANKFGG